MIETCGICAGTGVYFQPSYSNKPIIEFLTEVETKCPHCHGVGKHRTGEWTPLKSIPQPVLYELVKLKALVQEDIGKVTFVANQTDLRRMKDDELLTLLADCTRVGKLMEEQNWLVIY